MAKEEVTRKIVIDEQEQEVVGSEETVEAGTQVVELTEEETESEAVGRILSFFVGIRGNGVYRISSDASELSLRDHVEALATIEINSLAALLEQEDALEGIRLFKEMKEEIVEQAIDLIVDSSSASDEDKLAIKALYNN